jgi:hypothetical protein
MPSAYARETCSSMTRTQSVVPTSPIVTATTIRSAVTSTPCRTQSLVPIRPALRHPNAVVVQRVVADHLLRIMPAEVTHLCS